MKKKLSISIEEDKMELIDRFVKEGRFRNKSHLIEYSIDRFIKGEKNG